MDDIRLEDYFDVVIEPEHSKKVLLNFQDKYGYDSVKLYRLHKQDYKCYRDLDIVEKDYHSWIHHFIIFIQNGGDPLELSRGNWDLTINESDWETTQDQNIKLDKGGEDYSSLFLLL